MYIFRDQGWHGWRTHFFVGLLPKYSSLTIHEIQHVLWNSAISDNTWTLISLWFSNNQVVFFCLLNVWLSLCHHGLEWKKLRYLGSVQKSLCDRVSVTCCWIWLSTSQTYRKSSIFSSQREGVTCHGIDSFRQTPSQWHSLEIQPAEVILLFERKVKHCIYTIKVMQLKK